MVVTVFSIMIAVSLGIMVAMAVYVLHRCEGRKKISFVIITLPGIVLMLGFLLEINAFTDSTAIFARMVRDTGFSFSVSALLIFSIDYCDMRVTKPLVAVLMASSLAISILVWTNESHYLFYRDTGLGTDSFVPYFSRTMGPLGIAGNIHTVICVLAGVGVLSYKFIKSDAKTRSKLVLLVIGTAVIVVSNIAHIVNPFGLPINYGVFASLIFIFLAFINIRKNNMLDAIQLDEAGMDLFSRILLDASPMMMEIWDENFQIVGCNKKLLETFGVKSKEEYYSVYYNVSPEFERSGRPAHEESNEFIRKVFEKGKHLVEWQHVLSNGELLPVESYGVCVNYRGKRLAVEFMRDLRQVKAAQAKEREARERARRTEIAEESNKAKTRFLARISHEIRTPITSVMGISEIRLQDPFITIENEEAFAKINSSAHILAAIVDDLLDMSKIEAGKMEIIAEEYEMASLISDVSIIHLSHIGDKEIKFVLNADENLPAFLIGDSVRIGQILNNILSNAFKYTEAGSVVLDIKRGEALDTDFILLNITVTDTGFGMTEEQLENLFDEYARFHVSEQRDVSGTGLGMPIVYSLVQAMGAKIEIESEKNRGTTVFISIPQKISGDKVLGAEAVTQLQRFEGYARRQKFDAVPIPNGNVLVVDDLDANLYVAHGLLSLYNLKVETCTSGFGAIEKIRQGCEYDIIFMDITMPGISGTETMRTLRENGYTRAIVALTANAVIGQAEEYLKSGFDGFIPKPINSKHLDAILTRFIRNKIDAPAGKPQNDDTPNKLRADFARTQKTVVSDIKNALRENDTKTAHRLAHSLKSLSFLIDESELANIAGKAEHELNNNRIPSDEIISAIEAELSRVLETIGEPEKTAPTTALASPQEIIETLEKLEPLLKSQDAASVFALESLRSFAEAAVLIHQIENYDFEAAVTTARDLRRVFALR